jgi:hypothetical protein
MRLYALVDDRLAGDHLRGVIELYGSRAAAERAMHGVFRDEPTLASFVRVAEFPLVELPVPQRHLN